MIFMNHKAFKTLNIHEKTNLTCFYASPGFWTAFSLCNSDSQTRIIKKKFWMTQAVKFNSWISSSRCPLYDIFFGGNHRHLEHCSIVEKTQVDLSGFDPQGQRGAIQQWCTLKATKFSSVTFLRRFPHHSRLSGPPQSNCCLLNAPLDFSLLTQKMSAYDVGSYCVQETWK